LRCSGEIGKCQYHRYSNRLGPSATATSLQRRQEATHAAGLRTDVKTGKLNPTVPTAVETPGDRHHRPLYGRCGRRSRDRTTKGPASEKKIRLAILVKPRTLGAKKKHSYRLYPSAPRELRSGNDARRDSSTGLNCGHNSRLPRLPPCDAVHLTKRDENVISSERRHRSTTRNRQE